MLVHGATITIRQLLLAHLTPAVRTSRDDMRLHGYEDHQPEIDVCEGVQ
jgi:hypothetical protein